MITLKRLKYKISPIKNTTMSEQEVINTASKIIYDLCQSPSNSLAIESMSLIFANSVTIVYSNSTKIIDSIQYGATTYNTDINIQVPYVAPYQTSVSTHFIVNTPYDTLASRTETIWGLLGTSFDITSKSFSLPGGAPFSSNSLVFEMHNSIEPGHSVNLLAYKEFSNGNEEILISTHISPLTISMTDIKTFIQTLELTGSNLLHGGYSDSNTSGNVTLFIQDSGTLAIIGMFDITDILL